MSNDGFSSVQDAVAWAYERAPENLYIMKKKDGTPRFHLIRPGYEDFYNRNFTVVAKIEVKREVVHNVPPPPPPPVAALPQINIRCDNGTSLNVVRIEREDDGSLTAITNDGPQPPRQVYNGAYKVIEEVGELLQALGKLGPFPHGEHPDGGPNLRERLAEELADVRAATSYMTRANFNGDEMAEMYGRVVRKLDKYEKWGLTGFDANVDQS